MIKNFSKVKYNAKNDNQKPDSSGMDIPDYAYERMAKCLLPIMRAYFESEEGQAELKAGEEESKPGCAA